MVLSNTATPRYYGEFREKVIRGDIPVNKEISQQMNRIDAMISNPEFYYDDEAIEGFVRFCENELTLTDGSDLILLPSFKLWAEDVLAWYYFPERRIIDPRTGETRYKRTKRRLRNKQYIITARGSAKSIYGSCIQMYGLLIDTQTTQQTTTAPTTRQAKEIVQVLNTAIMRSQDRAREDGKAQLLSVLTDGSTKSRSNTALVSPIKDGIINRLTNSTLTIKPMSVDKLQGGREKYVTVDEWLSGEVREDVIGAFEQSAAKGDVDDYLIVAISSEGTVRDGVGDTIKMELASILNGDYDDPHTSIWHYKLDDVQEVNNPELWIKANPNLGITVSYDAYDRDVRRAEANPSTRNDMLAKRFGIPVEGYTFFFTYDEIQKHRPQSFRSLPCAMGMDASQGDDFWAFTFVFPLGRENYGIKTRSYVTRTKYAKLPAASQMKYDELVEEGTLIISDTPVLEWDFVYEDIMNYIIRNDYAVLCFGYDPYNAKEFVERWCSDNGELGVEVVRQGVRTESVPLGQLKNLAEERRLIFDEELMKYAMGNAIAILDNNDNYKLSKKRAGDKIDNVAALLDAWVALTRNKEMFM